jgi:hypothetical protein
MVGKSGKRGVERIGLRIKKLLSLMLDDEIAVDEGRRYSLPTESI